MNLMADKLSKLDGYSSDDIAKRSATHGIKLPSINNEEVIKQIIQITEEQESIGTLPSTQTVPPGPTSTPVVATSNQAEPKNETSTRAEPPNSLKKTGEDEYTEETNSKQIAPVNDTEKNTKDQAIADRDPSNKETEEITDEDLRISRLSEEELGKEGLALFNEMRFEEAKKRYERYKQLNQK
jgi:hypothetical protein